MNRTHQSSSAASQRGSVLLIAVVLLLLAGVMTLLALNVGVFESRSTANDLRAKAVNDVAEAGLAQGFEFLLRQHPSMLKDIDLSVWEKCGPNDLTFPCGAVGGVDPDNANQPRRATMFRLKANGQTITGLDAELARHMLKLNNLVPTSATGGFTVAYGVAPVACWVKKPVATDTTVRCAISIADATEQRIVTFVSVAAMPGEAARTTLIQTVGQYSLLGNMADVPPITASGAININGNIQIVANANAAGPGVPVSVWTRQDVTKQGNPNTCYAEEFFRYGGVQGNSGKPPTSSPAIWEGTKPDGTGGTLTCDTCNCAGDKSLSFPHSGNKVGEGMDILDVDGNVAGGDPLQENRDVKEEEFPCDLFEYVFGVKAWSDGGLPDPPYVDHFCETRMPKVAYTVPTTGLPYPGGLDVDEKYLYTNAAQVMYRDDDAKDLLKPAQQMSAAFTAETGPTASGMIWCQKECGLNSGITIGSPNAPVVIIMDGSVTLKARVFGVIFLRSTGPGPLNKDTGGNAQLSIHTNGAAVYGAVVVQGNTSNLNGGVVVSDPTVLGNIGSNPNNTRYATLPGAWNDQRSY